MLRPFPHETKSHLSPSTPPHGTINCPFYPYPQPPLVRRLPATYLDEGVALACLDPVGDPPQLRVQLLGPRLGLTLAQLLRGSQTTISQVRACRKHQQPSPNGAGPRCHRSPPFLPFALPLWPPPLSHGLTCARGRFCICCVQLASNRSQCVASSVSLCASKAVTSRCSRSLADRAACRTSTRPLHTTPNTTVKNQAIQRPSFTRTLHICVCGVNRLPSSPPPLPLCHVSACGLPVLCP